MADQTTEPDEKSHSKTSSDNKVDKKYATLSARSISTLAESAGFPSISNEIATILAQDICYRLRETAQASTQFMKHAKRKKLSVDDFNKALKWSDVEPIFGYGSQKALNFKHMKDSDLCFVEDKEVNLVPISLDVKVPPTSGKSAVKASWLALEGVHKGSSTSTGSSGVKHKLTDLSEELQKYFQEVTKVILENETDGIKKVLTDLATNPRISSLLPYFVSFVESGVKMVSHDLVQLSTLLQAVEAILRNNFCYLGPYVSKLLSSVTYCILEPLAASINPLNDHWSLRVYASRLLYPLVNCCHPRPQGVFPHLLQSLKEVLADSARPLCSHYGAIISLSALGPQAIEEVLVPVLPTYWQFLQPILEDNSVSSTHIRGDGQKVYGSVQNAAEILLKAKYTSLQKCMASSASGPSERTQVTSTSTGAANATIADDSEGDRQLKPEDINSLYSKFQDYLGDSITMRLYFKGPYNFSKPSVGLQGDKVALHDLVNKKVVFNGTRFERKRERTEEDENEAKIRFLSRPPKLGGYGREGLRKRPGKIIRRQRSRSQSFREAFPLAKTVRTYGKFNLSGFLSLPGYIDPLPVRHKLIIGDDEKSATPQSATWRVNQKMKSVGKRKPTTVNAFKQATPFYLGIIL